MSNQNIGLNDFVEEIVKYKQELSNLEELLKAKDSTISNKVSSQEEQINNLQKELNLTKEINDKTKEYLLLEIQSILDKQNIAQDKQNNIINKYDEKFDIINKSLITKEEKIDQE